MRSERRRVRWCWIGLSLSALVAGGLAAGCGGESDGGDANYSQKFEKPAGPEPVVKARPDPHGRRDANDLSPRERRALRNAK